MAACSDVKTCLAEGSTECTAAASVKCPPCVYALTGGDYSCYSRKTTGDCPFSGPFAECDKATSASASSKHSTTPSTDSSTTDSTVTPTSRPRKVIAEASTEAFREDRPATTAETPVSDRTDPAVSESISTDDTATRRPTASSGAPTTVSGSDALPSSETPASGTADSGAVPTGKGNTMATNSSAPMAANLALIGGAVVLLVIVIAFITRQVVKKKRMTHKLPRAASTRASRQSDGTLSSGASSAIMYSTHRYRIEVENENGVSMLSDSHATSTYGPGYTDHNTNNRFQADFSNYGGSQFAENSQYFSVSTGPGVVASGQRQYAKRGMFPPSTQAGNHFVDVTTSPRSTRPSKLDSARSDGHPLTVSQLMPTAIGEQEEEAHATHHHHHHHQQQQQQSGLLQYGHVQPRVYDSAVSQRTRQPPLFGASTASSMRSDYDIVDPLTMQEVEARNTEMLAEHHCYPKFSFESEVDMYDGGSSEEESSDDESMRHTVEHTI